MCVSFGVSQLRLRYRGERALQRFEREGAVHRAAVEIEIAEDAGDEPRYAAFAEPAGAVDGDGELACAETMC